MRREPTGGQRWAARSTSGRACARPGVASHASNSGRASSPDLVLRPTHQTTDGPRRSTWCCGPRIKQRTGLERLVLRPTHQTADGPRETPTSTGGSLAAGALPLPSNRWAQRSEADAANAAMVRHLSGLVPSVLLPLMRHAQHGRSARAALPGPLRQGRSSMPVECGCSGPGDEVEQPLFLGPTFAPAEDPERGECHQRGGRQQDDHALRPSGRGTASELRV
ncbi:hypothetical protein BH20CHL5_BH20CHL5_14010 [soil metagenome]